MGILLPRSIYFASPGPERPHYVICCGLGEEMVLLQPCKHCPDLWGEEDNNLLFQRQILNVPATGFVQSLYI